MSGIKICWFGIYNSEYSRNYVFLEGLSDLGEKVIECRVDAKESFKHLKLAWRYLHLNEPVDVIYVAFPAQSIVIVAKILTLFSKRVVVMDAFYSMYESIIHDRKLLYKWHPLVVKTAILDWISVRFADHVIVDTQAHKKYWQTNWGARPEKMTVIPVGSSTRRFYPPKERSKHKGFLISFHGTYIPLQGADVVVAAAALLKGYNDIHFRMIGKGQTYDSIRRQAEGLTNIDFVDRVSLSKLNRYIGEADISLGIFGRTAKTSRVVPNKLFEGLAAGKPVITIDTRAARELFSDRDVCFIKGTPEALAEAIVRLTQNVKQRQFLAENGHQTFLTNFTEQVVATRLVACLVRSVTNR